MIGSQLRLGLAVLVAVLAVLIGLGVLILRGPGSVEPEFLLDIAPAAAEAAAPVNGAGPASRTTGRQPSPGVDPAWSARMGARAGIPVPAIQAYADAELTLGREEPGCNLSWNTLAGIGWIESHHGTIGDRTLGVDGRSSTPIIGPALDGRQFAAIRATAASARWHGDPRWDHAVGPLQFISETWERWAADGDGDGVADPLDIDDAALAAGRYLCADDHDLSSATGWSSAVHSYNHSNPYVLSVLAAANSYATRTDG